MVKGFLQRVGNWQLDNILILILTIILFIHISQIMCDISFHILENVLRAPKWFNPGLQVLVKHFLSND